MFPNKFSLAGYYKVSYLIVGQYSYSIFFRLSVDFRICDLENNSSGSTFTDIHGMCVRVCVCSHMTVCSCGVRDVYVRCVRARVCECVRAPG